MIALNANTVALPGPSSFIALGIAAYQRFLSPYKGFRCAHRALHGRESCSQFAKRVTLKWGAAAMLPLLRRRFLECAVAKEVLDYESRTRRHQDDEEEERRRGQQSQSSADACDAGSCPSGSSDCGSPLPDFGGCAGVDVSLPDADCGACGDLGDCAGGIADCGF